MNHEKMAVQLFEELSRTSPAETRLGRIRHVVRLVASIERNTFRRERDRLRAECEARRKARLASRRPLGGKPEEGAQALHSAIDANPSHVDAALGPQDAPRGGEGGDG